MPGTTTTASGIARQPFRDPQCDQFRATTPRCFPLPPQGGPESQPDPASESNWHFGRFAKAEIAAPAPHIRGQLFHCRLDAHTLTLPEPVAVIAYQNKEHVYDIL